MDGEGGALHEGAQVDALSQLLLGQASQDGSLLAQPHLRGNFYHFLKATRPVVHADRIAEASNKPNACLELNTYCCSSFASPT